MKMDLTEKDQQLIDALNRNARTTISELARMLGISRTTVNQRLSRLEHAGIISGYKVVLGEAYRNNTLQSYVNLQVRPQRARQLIDQLKKIPHIEALFSVSGKFDMVLLVRTLQTSQLDELLDIIGTLDGVVSTESAIVLSTKFDHR